MSADVQILRGDSGDCTVTVPKTFVAKTGKPLLPEIFVGRALGKGLQGAVFELTDNMKRPLGWVLKSVTAGPAAKFACLFPGIEREWLVGRELCLALGERHLHGFMRTGAVIRAEGSGKVLGIVIEQMSGETIDKHLLAARTAALDVLFIRAMLRQVFTALAGAQEAIGFRHWDLRLANVMQHSLQAQFQAPAQPKDGAAPNDHAVHSSSQGDACFKMIDFGHGNLHDGHLGATGIDAGKHSSPKLPGIPLTEYGYRLFWHREGDVFRLLMSLQNVIDSCTWPQKDEVLVRQLAGLICHVTGIQLKVRWQDKGQLSCAPCKDTILRRWSIRAKSFWFPSTPGITAGEALVHPFFSLSQVSAPSQ